MNVLFIDACPRGREYSRSYRLGRAFMDEYMDLHPGLDVTEYRLDDMNLAPFTGKWVRDRDALLREGKLDAPRFEYAWAFRKADMIVVCAPYWDFAFPASLKTFIEHVSVSEITFTYDEAGPVGLCRAENLVYLTTAGSPMGEDNWGGDYLRAVTGKLMGVKRFHQVSAEGLDIVGADVQGIMDAAVRQAQDLARRI